MFVSVIISISGKILFCLLFDKMQFLKDEWSEHRFFAYFFNVIDVHLFFFTVIFDILQVKCRVQCMTVIHCLRHYQNVKLSFFSITFSNSSNTDTKVFNESSFTGRALLDLFSPRSLFCAFVDNIYDKNATAA